MNMNAYAEHNARKEFKPKPVPVGKPMDVMELGELDPRVVRQIMVAKLRARNPGIEVVEHYTP